MLAEQQEHSVSPRPAAGPAAGTSSRTIHAWSVVGYDRIVGMVRAGTDPRGKAIITSPVLRISFLGAARTPIALTQSGSLYSLGEPAVSFGTERAQDFLRYKAGEPPAPPIQPAPRLPTALMKIEP
jgi:hypothetical protein